MEKKIDDNKDNFLKEDTFIFKKYKPIRKIGIGAFGDIYSVIDLNYKTSFAMKTEKIEAEPKSLETEAYYLYNLQGGIGIPKIITYGHIKKYNILIETLLNESLYNIYIKNNKYCSLIDICLIGVQMLERLEWIHSKNILYRDVKPENCLIGLKNPNLIYIVDFGLCKRYRSSKTGKHIPMRQTGKFNGTMEYASSYVLKGNESSRRDDLISLGYMLIFLFKKYLPWKISLKEINRTKYLELINKKESNDNGLLFKNLPQEIVEYIIYTNNLKFEQAPDYSYLSSLFKSIIFKMNLNYNKLSFSWITKPNKEAQNMTNSKLLISNNQIGLTNIKELKTKKINQREMNEQKPIINNNDIFGKQKKLNFMKYKKLNDEKSNKSLYSNQVNYNTSIKLSNNDKKANNNQASNDNSVNLFNNIKKNKKIIINIKNYQNNNFHDEIYLNNTNSKKVYLNKMKKIIDFKNNNLNKNDYQKLFGNKTLLQKSYTPNPINIYKNSKSEKIYLKYNTDDIFNNFIDKNMENIITNNLLKIQNRNKTKKKKKYKKKLK
jgi:serine/threonine protein kinase